MSNRCARSFSRTRGTITASANLRAVSEISRCSSLRVRSTAASRGGGRQLQLDRSRQRRGGPFAGRLADGREVVPVDGRDRLDLAVRRREERLGGAGELEPRELALGAL